MQAVSSEQVLDFDDIFDVWQLAWWQQPWVWFAGAIALVLLLGLGYYVVMEIRSRTAVYDPREAALKRLYALNPVVGFTCQQDFKRFYAESLATIKLYLAERYGYTSRAQTDQELLISLQKNQKFALFHPVVKRLLEHGLRIKFAYHNGTVEQVKSDYSSVLETFSQEKFSELA